MIDWLFTNALAAMALAMIATLVIWAFRPAPAVRHALWLVVVLKLVSPTGLMLSVPLPVEAPEAAVAQTRHRALEPADFLVQEELFTVIVRPRPGQSTEEAALAALNCPTPRESAESTKATASIDRVPASKPLDYRPLLLACWLAGATFVGWRQLRDTIRFARFTRKSHPAGDALLAEVVLVANRLGVRVPVVRVLPGLSSPVLWCLLKPVLLWPAGLDCRLKGEGRRAVLAHELAHLRRRDHWSRRLEMIASVLHWWNPLFWIARKKMRADAELACDAWAAGQADRRVYAEALLEVCSFHPRRRPVPAVGVIGEGRHAMQERLTMIMRERVPCRLAFGAKLIVALMAIAAVPAWTLGQAAPPAAPLSDPQSQAIEAQIRALTEKLEAMKAVKRAEAEKQAAESKNKAIEALVERLNVLHLRIEKDVTTARPEAPAVKVLTPGQGGVKIIGADGKELKDVKVIIVDSKTGDRNVTVTASPAVASPVTKPLHAGTKPSTFTTPDGKTVVVEVGGESVKATKPGTLTTPDGGTIFLEVVGDGTKAAKPTTITLSDGKTATWVREVQGDPLTTNHAVTWAARTIDAGNSITLSRATYKIGKDQSVALASLLGSIKATVMETKVDGESITVTTTPEAQRSIGQIVQLMKGADVQGRTIDFRFTPVTPATPATPAAPAAPRAPVAPKAPATPKPASFEYKLADPKQNFEFFIKPLEGKIDAEKPVERSRLAVPSNALPNKTETKPVAPAKP